MNRFYNAMIALGVAATVGTGLIVGTSPLPAWKWPLWLVLLLFTEWGCFAWRDKKNDESK